MSKRTPGLPRRPNEFWATPRAAVAPLVPHLPTGRVSWMGNGEAGKDNAAWYLFHSAIPGAGPRVLARGGAK